MAQAHGWRFNTVGILAVLLAACSSEANTQSPTDEDVGGSGGTALGSGGRAPGQDAGKGGTGGVRSGAGGSTGAGGAKSTGGATSSGGTTGSGGAPKTDGGGTGGTSTGNDSGPTEAGSGSLALGADGKLTIWTVGDSITNNSGYRTRMCTTLTGEGYSIWFVGSLKGGGTPCNQGDNDGHSGFSISGIVDGVSGSGTYADWHAAIAKPQLATLMIGTNNVAWWVAAGADMADVADECMALVDKILALDPKLFLIVGTIPPESSTVVQAINRDRADLANEYNAALKLKVPAHAQYGKRLFFADTNAGLTVADLYDGIHPNATGHDKIGDTWLSVLTPLLPPP
jgi:lysophospholipase L1-like esterase